MSILEFRGYKAFYKANIKIYNGYIIAIWYLCLNFIIVKLKTYIRTLNKWIIFSMNEATCFRLSLIFIQISSQLIMIIH